MIRQRSSLLLLVLCLVCAASMAWGRGPSRLAGGGNPDPDDKVTLCHVPRGNPENAHTITVGEAAVPAHLAHGDPLGECAPTCDAGPSAPVPKTGQTGCWDVNGAPIDCAGTGQDGEYQKGVSISPRFTDNGDGTVTDNLTGLIWLKNANCFDVKVWAEAINLSSTLANGSCGLTDASVAGDWRLPNVRELLSLIDFGQSDPSLPSGHPFTGALPQHYWSSSTWWQPERAWYVSFLDGAVSADLKVDPAQIIYVWPVRGGQ